MKNNRVIIVDDDPDIRDSLQAWLVEDYQVLTYDSAESFLIAINDFDFEDGITSCLLLDFQMPGMNGVELQKALKAINVAFPIIFMSGNAHQSDVIDAWHEGAVDFVLKPFTTAKISDSLTKLFNGIKSNSFHQEDTSINQSPIDPSITQREAQVLFLIGKGYQQQEVAEILGISLRSVKMYRAYLKNKLNLHTLMEIGRYCDKYQASIERIAMLNKV